MSRLSLQHFLKTNARWLSAGGLLMFSSSFGQTFFISIFAGQIMQSYGLSDGDWGRIYGSGTLASGLLMLWAGAYTDVYRAKTLAVVMFLLMSGFCLAMAFNTSAALLIVVIFGLRFSGQGMLSHIAMVAMGRWFIAARGKAAAIATLGFSVGEAFLPMLFVALMAFATWQSLWILAGLVALLFIPLLRFLLSEERTPQSIAEESHAVGMSGLHWTRARVLRHWLFWLVLPATAAPPMMGTAFFFQQVHFATSKGWEHAHLVALFPFYTLTTVASVLLFGAAIDRWGSSVMMPLFQLPMAAAFLALGASTSLTHAMIGLVLLALMQGGNGVVPLAFWSEYYGTRHLGAIKAMAAAVMVVSSAIGPALTGALIDRGIPFADQMVWIAVYTVGASALVWIAVARAKPSLQHPIAAA
jgi:MFS family permease